MKETIAKVISPDLRATYGIKMLYSLLDFVIKYYNEASNCELSMSMNFQKKFLLFEVFLVSPDFSKLMPC